MASFTAGVDRAFLYTITEGNWNDLLGATGSLNYLKDSPTFDGSIVVTKGLIVNEGGGDFDTRIEGLNNVNLFYVDAGNDRIGIGEASPDTTLHVAGDVTIKGGSPDLLMIETSVAANNTTWGISVNAEILSYKVLNDAQDAGVAYLTVERTANTIDALTLTATTLTIAGDLVVSGTGPHAIGGAVNTAYQFHITGAYTSDGVSNRIIGFLLDSDITGITGDTVRQNMMEITGTVTTQNNSETVAIVASAYISEPVITKGTDTVTLAATLYVIGNPTEATDNFNALFEASNSQDLNIGLWADRGDQDVDKWRLNVADSNGNLTFQSKTSGSYVAKLTVTPVGNFGVGTASPSTPLTVVGSDYNILSTNVETDATLKRAGFLGKHYTNAEQNIALLISIQQAAVTDVHIGGGDSALNTATGLHFYTAANNTTLIGTERLTILAGGNVGINTASPGSTLELLGTANSVTNGSILLRNYNAGTGTLVNTQYYNAVDGYVWMGLGGTGYTTLGALQDAAYILAGVNVSGGINLYNEGNNPIIFTTNDIEKGRVDTGGEWSIGANHTTDGQMHILAGATNTVGLVVESLASTTADAQTWQYDGVDGASLFVGATSAFFVMLSRDFGNNLPGPAIGCYRNTNSDTEGPAAGTLFLEQADGTDRFLWVDSAGDLKIHFGPPSGSTGTPNVEDDAGVVVGDQSSWYKLKQNIDKFVDNQEALDAVLATDLYEFDMKDNHHTGLVIYEKDRGSWFSYNDDLKIQQTPCLDERTIHGYTLASIKALNAKIQDLQSQIATIKEEQM